MEAAQPTNLPSLTSLPYELIFNVLKNLPAKTLLRCRCVCKEWNSIITDQSFVNAHLLSQPEGYLLSHVYQPMHQPSSLTSDKSQFCSFFPDESFSIVHKFKIPLPYSFQQEPGRILVGSINGLLCLSDSKPLGRKLHLWNPTIRKYKTLSNTCFKGKNHQRYFHPKTDTGLGFGFRALTADYIIIRIAVFKWRSRRLKSRPLPQAEAYSSSTDSWKRVEFSEDISRRLMSILESWQYAHVNGDLNWTAMFTDGEGRPYKSILSFDLNKEQFREIKLPRDYRNGINVISKRITINRGLLAVVISGYPKPADGKVYDWLWTMEKYGKVDSWKRTTVQTTVKATELRFFLGYTLHGRIMFRKNDCFGCRFELLDMETLQKQQIIVFAFQSMHSFKETLVSLEGANVMYE